MSAISQQRELVKRAYPHSKTWPLKVDRMPDGQVQAIFIRFKKEGKI